MSAFSLALAAHVHDRYGIVSDGELRALGISVAQRERLVTAGVLVPLLRGVYRLRSTPMSLEGRCLAICLADDRAYVTGRAGGRLWGVRRMGTVDLIDARVPHFANSLGAEWVRLRRCNVLDPIDVVERADGIRVASPPRLLFDLAESLDDLDLESVVEQVLDKRWLTMPTLHATARRLCHPARPGSDRFARVLGSRPDFLRPADSHLEVQLLDALRAAGVRDLVRQLPVRLPNGVVVHPDLAVPATRWAIEVDHVTWHGGRVASQADKQRDRLMRRIGWHVDRVTDEEITNDLPGLVAELLSGHPVRELRSA
jgi:very-short-patch-repair endonuclease